MIRYRVGIGFSLALVGSGCKHYFNACEDLCHVYYKICDSDPFREGEFIALAQHTNSPDTTFVGLPGFWVGPGQPIEISAWKIRYPDGIEDELGVGANSEEILRKWFSEGVVLEDWALAWAPIPSLHEPELGIVLHSDGAWQTPDTFPEWARETSISPDEPWSAIIAWGQTQPAPPAVEYHICRYYVGDVELEDAYGSGGKGCVHPDLPDP